MENKNDYDEFFEYLKGKVMEKTARQYIYCFSRFYTFLNSDEYQLGRDKKNEERVKELLTNGEWSFSQEDFTIKNYKNYLNKKFPFIRDTKKIEDYSNDEIILFSNDNLVKALSLSFTGETIAALNNFIEFRNSYSKNSILNHDFENLKFPYQRIIYGAPGTGKSNLLAKQSEKFVTVEKFGENLIFPDDKSFWLLGATVDMKDHSQKFIESGNWFQGGENEKYNNRVRKISVGDFVAIKSNNSSAGSIILKSIGEVTKNLDDGKEIKVLWKPIERKKIPLGNQYLSRISKVEDRNHIEKIFGELFEKEHIPDKISDRRERVTFYDGYTYGQFVGSYKPISDFEKNDDGEETDKKIISYEYVAGPLLRQIINAYLNPKTNFLLIIEEINRAKADRVFGNTFQLLDRCKDGNSEYSIALSEEQKIYLKNVLGEKYYEIEESGLYFPKNFYIWCTMNSADQGVYPMDTAFKRRWNFEYIPLNEGEKHCANFEIEIKPFGKINWNKFRRVVNNLLENKIPEDRLLAPFFIKEDDFKNNDGDIFLNKVLMYLFDDVLRHKEKTILFDSKINCFSKLFENYNNGENIFNDELKKMLGSQDGQ